MHVNKPCHYNYIILVHITVPILLSGCLLNCGKISDCIILFVLYSENKIRFYLICFVVCFQPVHVLG